MRVRNWMLVIGAAVAVSACDADRERAGCDAAALPVQGASDAPIVTSVILEVSDAGVTVLATATDAQGSANLLDVTQSVGVYADDTCGGTTIVIEDDLSGSGVEEAFGLVIEGAFTGTAATGGFAGSI